MKKIMILFLLLTPILFSQQRKILDSTHQDSAHNYYHADIFNSINQDNPDFQLVELNTWTWNWGVWVVEFKVMHEYNHKNLLVKRHDKKWNNDQWESSSRTTFVYDNNDQLIIQIGFHIP